MIFELSFEHRGFGNNLGFFLQNILLNYKDLKYSIFHKNKEDLRLWIECENSEMIEEIAQDLSEKIPQSIYLDEVSSNIFASKTLPQSLNFVKPKSSAFFCPQCLKTQEDICEVCHQEVKRISKQVLEEIIKELLEGKKLKLKTPSGEHILSLEPSLRIYCLDIEKILEVCTPTNKELVALASYERPTLRIKSYGEYIQNEYVAISLAQDKILLDLFELLKGRGVSFVYGGSEVQKVYELSEIVSCSDELVVYENEHFAILKTQEIDRDLKEKFLSMQSEDKAFLSTIITENHLEQSNILNFYFSKKGQDKISLYNSQTQWFNEIMSFSLPKDLFTLLEEIKALDEGGERLIANFSQKFPHLLEKNIDFSSFPQGIYGIWEIVRVLLRLKQNPLQIAQNNLDKRGVAIDYVFEKDSLILQRFNIARCIRSAMSFKMAGVEDEIIALGYIESFSHLSSKIYIAIRGLVDIEGISLSGDLFANKMIGDFFYFNNRQSMIYRNKKFPLLFQR